MNAAKPQFTVLDNPEKDLQELTEIKNIAIRQLEKANIKGAFISKEAAEDINSSLNEFISEKLESYGLTVPKLSIQVKSNSVNVNVVASTIGTTGMNVFHADFLEHGAKYGLRSEWLGSSFIHIAPKPAPPAFLTVTGLDLSRDEPFIRLTQLRDGKTTPVRTRLSDVTIKQIGVAIAKYKSAFEI